MSQSHTAETPSNTATTSPTTTTIDSAILNRFISNNYIKNRIDIIKKDDEFRNENDLKGSDNRRSIIMEMAEYLEGELNKFGSAFMIRDISTFITRIFERFGLERYSYLILEVLPDKYKDTKKNAYINHKSKLLANRVKRNITDINTVDVGAFNAESLYELKSMSLDLVDRFEKQLLVQNFPLDPEEYNKTKPQNQQIYLKTEDQTKSQANFNQLENLKDLEKNKFKKAVIGEPLSTVEKLCENPDYAKVYPELVKAFDQAIKGITIMSNWFTKEFPPLYVESCIELTDAVKMMNELLRPYFDKKYRRDHVQSVKIAYTKVIHTSTKASQESRIACAHYVDKNGLPIMRGLTKEQIDAMYDWEINFNHKLFNTVVKWPETFSKVNEQHGGRALEDRAIALSSTLSHFA
jgi:hypothetical protein